MKNFNFEGQGSLFEYMSGSNATVLVAEEKPVKGEVITIPTDGYETMEASLAPCIGDFLTPATIGTINVPELSERIKSLTSMLRPIILEETKAKIENLLDSADKRTEALKGLKSDRAYINKMIDAVKDKNSKVRQQVMAPYDEYMSSSKELTALFDEAKVLFDGEVKKIEQAEKDEKLSAVRSYFNEKALDVEGLTGEYRDVFFEKIFDKSWLNTTTSAKKYKDAIVKAISEFANGMQMLSMTQSNFQKEGIEVFKETLDMGKAATKMQELQKQADLILEREREKAEAEKQKALKEAEAKAQRELEAALERERIKAEEEKQKALAEEKRKAQEAQAQARQAMTAPGVVIPGVTAPTSTVGYVPTPNPTGTTVPDKVTVTFTKTQWEMVKMFCNTSGISYTVQ